MSIKSILTFIVSTVVMATLALGLSYAPSVSARVPTANELCGGTSCPLIADPDGFVGDGDLRTSITSIILTVAQFLTYIAVAVAIIYIVWGGYKWMDVNDPKGAETGQKIVTNAAIGLAVAILAATLVGLLANFLQGDISGGGGAATTATEETTGQ
jgi:hypothetical protein